MAITNPITATSGGLPFGWVGQAARLARKVGVPIDNLLIDTGVRRDTGSIDDSTLIDAAEYHVICNLMIHALDDELPGAGTRRMQRGSGALGLHVMASARTLRSALIALARMYTMIGDFCTLDLVEADGIAEVRINARMNAGPQASMVEEAMADWLFIKFCFLLDLPVRLTAFRTPAAGHPALGQRHPYFDCMVEPGPVTALRLPSSYLDLKPRADLSDQPTVEATMYWLGQVASRQAGPPGLDRPGSLSNRLLAILLHEDCSVEACCAALGSGERDLRRALFMEGTRFRDVRRAALWRRLAPLLNKGSSQEDIAAELGYSDGRSLRRGVKLATGLTMTDLRRLGRAGDIGFSPMVMTNLKSLLAVP